MIIDTSAVVAIIAIIAGAHQRVPSSSHNSQGDRGA